MAAWSRVFTVVQWNCHLVRIGVLGFIEYLRRHLEKFIQPINSASFSKSPLCTATRTWTGHALTSTVPLVNTLLATNKILTTFRKYYRRRHWSTLADCAPKGINHHLLYTYWYFRLFWNFKETGNVPFDGLNIVSNSIDAVSSLFCQGDIITFIAGWVGWNSYHLLRVTFSDSIYASASTLPEFQTWDVYYKSTNTYLHAAQMLLVTW